MPRWGLSVAWLLASMAIPACTRQLVVPGAGDATQPQGATDASIVADGSRFARDRFAASDLAPADARDGPGCSAFYQTLDTKPPVPTYVMLLVARNMSMATSFGFQTRIGAVQKVIRDSVAAYTPPSPTGAAVALNFGYLDFPEILDPSCAAGCCVGSAVAPSPLTKQQIWQALDPCDQGLATPGCLSTNDNRPMVAAFGAALDTFATQVHGVPASGARSVILFADNGPGCGGDSTPKACADLKQQVVALAQQAKTVTTYVIPIGQDFNCLNNIAMVGSTVLDLPGLQMSLSNILSDLAQPFCSISLNQEPRNKANVQVLNQGVPLPRDDWSFHFGSSVIIDVHGMSCAALQHVSADMITVREFTGCQP